MGGVGGRIGESVLGCEEVLEKVWESVLGCGGCGKVLGEVC